MGIANNRTMTPSADGSYELWLSPDPQPGKNWLKLEPDAVAGLTRDYLKHPEKDKKAVWTIETIDPPAAKQDDIKTLVKRFRAAKTWLNLRTAALNTHCGHARGAPASRRAAIGNSGAARRLVRSAMVRRCRTCVS